MYKDIKLYQETLDDRLLFEIVENHRYIIHKIALKISKQVNINIEELESYGLNGLVSAIINFDETIKTPFDFYAGKLVKSSINREISKNYGFDNSLFFYYYLKAKEKIETDNGIFIKEYPELIDLIMQILIKEGHIINDNKSIIYAKKKIINFEFGAIDINNIDLLALYNCEDVVVNNLLRDELNNVISHLIPRQQDVIKMYYMEQFSDYAIAELYKISAKRARDIRLTALYHLRKILDSEKMKHYL